MGESITNGEKSSSAFLSHLTSYPVIADGFSTYKSNPYGAKSLDIYSTLYSKFATPVLPYLSKPYSFVSPYVSKADQLGDKGLSTVDSHFPIVKEPTSKIIDTGKSYAYFPVVKATETKDWVFNTYGEEYKKNGGKEGGIVTPVKAVVTTGLVLTSETLAFIGSYLSAKKEQAKEVVNEKK